MTRTELKVKTWLKVAEDISALSTCFYTQVGCVLLTSDWRLISTGYNGSIEGHVHCNDLLWIKDRPEDRLLHSEHADKYEIHAEANAVRGAMKTHYDLKGLRCFTTISPCYQCMKQLASIGVTDLYFSNIYWRSSLWQVKDQARNLKLNIHYEETTQEKDTTDQQLCF